MATTQTPPPVAASVASPSHPWGASPYRPIPGWGPPAPPRPRGKPSPFRPKELAAALGLVVLVDVALWVRGASSGLAGGFGAGLLFAGVPIVLAIAARGIRRSVRLAVVSVLLGAVALRCALAPTVGTVFMGLALLSVFTATLRVRKTFVPEAVVSALSAFAKLGSRLAAGAVGVRRLFAHTRIGRVSLLPVLVPLGLSLVFGAVFALANPVVAHGLDVAWTAFTRFVELPSALRVFMWFLALVAACALLRPTCKLANSAEHEVDDRKASPTTLLVTRNALACLNVLFFAYDALDAAYLWSGSPPAGITTQQYAHQGAFWLTIALVLLTVVVSVMFRGPLAHDAQAKLQRRMAYVWMGQGLVLALGTYRRIAIHVDFSGLSDLRIVGILGTTLVLVGLALVAQKLAQRRTFAWLLRRQLDAFALTLALYTVAPTHWLSAHVNVARVASGEYRPVLHAFRQSHETESAAVLVPLLDHEDQRVRQGVAALLEEKRNKLRSDVDTQVTWRQQNVMSRRTLDALDAAAPKMTAVLGTVSRSAARDVLLEISRVANEGSLEELASIPTAEHWQGRGVERESD